MLSTNEGLVVDCRSGVCVMSDIHALMLIDHFLVEPQPSFQDVVSSLKGRYLNVDYYNRHRKGM